MSAWRYFLTNETYPHTILRREDRDQPIDATKIPEMYDYARFDLLHGSSYLLAANALDIVSDIFELINRLGPLVFSLESGITPEEKLEIGTKTIPKLIKKISDDLIFQYKKSIEFETNAIVHQPSWGRPSIQPSTWNQQNEIPGSPKCVGHEDDAGGRLPKRSNMCTANSVRNRSEISFPG